MGSLYFESPFFLKFDDRYQPKITFRKWVANKMIRCLLAVLILVLYFASALFVVSPILLSNKNDGLNQFALLFLSIPIGGSCLWFFSQIGGQLIKAQKYMEKQLMNDAKTEDISFDQSTIDKFSD
jgi:hypothetical protein